MAELIKKNNEYVVRHVTLPATAQISLDYGEVIEVNISLVDSRLRTEKQRKFIFALCNEMSHYTGDDVEWCRMYLQQEYANSLNIEVESLSKCSMTYATGLIKSMIDFFISNEIPFDESIIRNNEYSFTEKQVYMMCLKRICVVTGKRADLHHIDAIGMGNDRKKVSHVGRRILPLSREMHQKCHTMGDDKFIEYYHLTPIICDEKMEYFIKKGKIQCHKEK